MVDAGVALERNQIIEDERYWINRYGNDITIIFNAEDTITRDDYNSIKKKQTAPTNKVFTIKAYPITYNPTEKQLEKAGIQEKVDLMVTTSKKDWDLNGIDATKDLNLIKAEVIVNDETYVLKNKSLIGHIADTYSTVVLGLFKK